MSVSAVAVVALPFLTAFDFSEAGFHDPLTQLDGGPEVRFPFFPVRHPVGGQRM
jgi:hypothetical protein